MRALHMNMLVFGLFILAAGALFLITRQPDKEYAGLVIRCEWSKRDPVLTTSFNGVSKKEWIGGACDELRAQRGY